MTQRATAASLAHAVALVAILLTALAFATVTATGAPPVFSHDDGITPPPGQLGPEGAPNVGELPGVVVLLRLPGTVGGTAPDFAAGQTTTIADAAFASADSLDQYYPEQSQGRVTGVSGVPLGPYLGPAGSSVCSGSGNTRFVEILQWARDAAAADGRPIDPDEYLMVAVPYTDTCEPAGTGWVGAPGLVVYPSSDWTQRDVMTVLAHELGHNLGMDHARSHECPSGTPTGETGCANIEYGSPFSVMGNGWAAPGPNGLTAMNRAEAGWMAGRVQTITSGPQTVTLQASGGTAAGTQLLRVVDGADLWVEYQSAVGGGLFNAPITAGVLIRSDVPLAKTAPTDDALLKLHPEHSTAANKYALGVGERYTDPFTGMSVKVLAQDSAAAQVEVTFDFGDATPPPTPVVTGITVDQNGCATATVTRPLDGETTTRWEWQVDAGVLATTTLSTGPITLGCPGAGDHTFTITAVDAAGNRSGTASAGFTVVGGAPAPSPQPSTEPTPTPIGDICPQVRFVRRGDRVLVVLADVVRPASLWRGTRQVASVVRGDARVLDRPGRGRYTYVLRFPATATLSAKACRLGTVTLVGRPAGVRALRAQRVGNRIVLRWAPPALRGAGRLVYVVRQGRRTIGVTRGRAVVFASHPRRVNTPVAVQARDRARSWGPAVTVRPGNRTWRRR